MNSSKQPPKQYRDFIARFPKLGDAWDSLQAAGAEGPLDERTQRLVKFAIAVGALREGAAHASVRKALALGISREELEQVVVLAAGTMGLPSTVAAYGWVRDIVEKDTRA